jgi:preprotein translocase subunit Sss1
VITRQITPKTKAPVESQKGLSKRVLWTIVVIVVVGIVGIAIAVAAASTQTA